MGDSAVIVVGAGPSGLATSACLNVHSIPHILLEREDCSASLWKKYSYDRLHLHLRKQHCQLPHMPFPQSYPNYVPKNLFLQYLDDYVSKFNISPLYGRFVELAKYDELTKKWKVTAKNSNSGQLEEYSARFLVVASGESCDPYIPNVEGLNTFLGEILHSTKFKNGKAYHGKRVLVVGSGNSGMEIALDLANHGAKTSIVIRSPVIQFTKILFSTIVFIYIYEECGTILETRKLTVTFPQQIFSPRFQLLNNFSLIDDLNFLKTYKLLCVHFFFPI